jgi:hypothetical protein
MFIKCIYVMLNHNVEYINYIYCQDNLLSGKTSQDNGDHPFNNKIDIIIDNFLP